MIIRRVSGHDRVPARHLSKSSMLVSIQRRNQSRKKNSNEALQNLHLSGLQICVLSPNHLPFDPRPITVHLQNHHLSGLLLKRRTRLVHSLIKPRHSVHQTSTTAALMSILTAVATSVAVAVEDRAATVRNIDNRILLSKYISFFLNTEYDISFQYALVRWDLRSKLGQVCAIFHSYNFTSTKFMRSNYLYFRSFGFPSGKPNVAQTRESNMTMKEWECGFSLLLSLQSNSWIGSGTA